MPRRTSRRQHAHGVAVALLLAGLALPPGASASTASVLAGSGDGPTLAVTDGAGGLQGYVALCPVGCARGAPFQLVLPSAGRDFYCVAIHRADAPGNDMAFYIRDSGNGLTSFDAYSWVSGLSGTDCSRFPDPPGAWIALRYGDYVATSA